MSDKPPAPTLDDATSPDRRAGALTEIARLARAHSLSVDEITARLVLETSPVAGRTPFALNRLLFYMGGVFIFTGLGLFIQNYWDVMDSLTRVLVTLGPALLALLCGYIAANTPRAARAATPLYLIAYLLQSVGFFTVLHEYAGGGNALLAGMIVFGFLSAQAIALFATQRLTSLLFFSVTYGYIAAANALALLHIPADVNAFVLGLSALLVSYGIGQTPWRAFSPFIFFVSGLAAGIGAYGIVHDHYPLDFGLVGLAALLIYASVAAQSRSLLCASVFVTMGYLMHYSSTYFSGMVGWPLTLVVTGVVMVGLGLYAVRLIQRIGASAKNA